MASQSSFNITVRPIPNIDDHIADHPHYGLCIRREGQWLPAIWHHRFVRSLNPAIYGDHRYDVRPTRDPTAPEDQTMFLAAHRHWSFITRARRPGLLFQLNPPNRWTGSGVVPLLRTTLINPIQRVVVDIVTQRPLRDFPGIPMQLSTQAESGRLEAIMRQDRRINFDDLLQRMLPTLHQGEPVPGPAGVTSIINRFDHKRPTDSQLRASLQNYRIQHRCLSWRARSATGSVFDQRLLNDLQPADLSANTTQNLPDLTDNDISYMRSLKKSQGSSRSSSTGTHGPGRNPAAATTARVTGNLPSNIQGLGPPPATSAAAPLTVAPPPALAALAHPYAPLAPATGFVPLVFGPGATINPAHLTLPAPAQLPPDPDELPELESSDTDIPSPLASPFPASPLAAPDLAPSWAPAVPPAPAAPPGYFNQYNAPYVPWQGPYMFGTPPPAGAPVATPTTPHALASYSAPAPVLARPFHIGPASAHPLPSATGSVPSLTYSYSPSRPGSSREADDLPTPTASTPSGWNPPGHDDNDYGEPENQINLGSNDLVGVGAVYSDGDEEEEEDEPRKKQRRTR